MFNIDDIPTNLPIGPLADGVYQVVVTEAAHVSDNEGSRFELTFLVPDKNRKVWGRYLYEGGQLTKPTALDVNRKQLADLFFAFGQKGFDTKEQAVELAQKMIGTEFFIRTKNNDFQGKTYTRIEDIWSIDGKNRNNKPCPKQATKKEDLPF